MVVGVCTVCVHADPCMHVPLYVCIIGVDVRVNTYIRFLCFVCLFF